MSEQANEEVVEYQMLPPQVEEILHNAGIEVRKIPIGGEGVMTLLRFHTNHKIYTIRLDEGGVETLVKALTGAQAQSQGVLIAKPGDIPGLKG